MKILILDNDSDYSSKLKERMKEEGHDAFTVAGPMDALISFNKYGNPDLLIMEIKLPSVSGYNFIQQVRKEVGKVDFPIIALSEYGRDEDISRTFSLGVFDYILKKSGFEKNADRILFNIDIIKQINKLISGDNLPSSKLEDIPLSQFLKIIKIRQKSGMVSINETEVLYINNGEIYSAAIGGIQGESALYYLINKAKGNISFKAVSEITMEKNIEVDFFETLIVFKEIEEKYEATLTLIPYKRIGTGADSIIEAEDVHKQYFFNLIDNLSTIKELIEREHLEEWLAVYYFRKLEKDHAIKLAQRDNLPGGIYSIGQHGPYGIRLLLVGKFQNRLQTLFDTLKKLPQIIAIDKVQNSTEASEKVHEFNPNVIIWDAEIQQSNNQMAIHQLELTNPVPIIMMNMSLSSEYDTLIDSLRFGAVDYYLEQIGEEGVASQQKNEIVRKLISAANINVNSVQHIKLKGYKRNQDKDMPPSDNLIILNASSGSYNALLRIIPYLPGNLKTSVVVLSDLDEKYLEPFVQYLEIISEMKIKAGNGAETLLAGTCYFISKDKSAIFKKDNTVYKLMVEKSTIENGDGEQVDRGMYSAAVLYKTQCTGILLSGVSEDGVAGIGAIKWNQGYTIVQYPGTCIKPEGPLAALKINAAHEVVVINKIAEKIIDHVTMISNFI